jgi:hypothetical protein
MIPWEFALSAKLDLPDLVTVDSGDHSMTGFMAAIVLNRWLVHTRLTSGGVKSWTGLLCLLGVSDLARQPATTVWRQE